MLRRRRSVSKQPVSIDDFGFIDLIRTINCNIAGEVGRKAKQRFAKVNNADKLKTKVVFNVNYPTKDPLLNMADYFCWSIQRIFERGETRFYDAIKEKVDLIIDLYDREKFTDQRNYYSKENPLTAINKISPLKH